MKRVNTHHAGAAFACVGSLVVAGCALAALMPELALAEEGGAGADILIPKAMEFIPALIAFLIIWLLLSKLVWPQILRVFDKRQEKIRGDLEAAEQARLAADEKLKACEDKIISAHREAEEIIAAAKKEAEELRASTMTKAQNEAQAVIQKAHAAVDSERHKAMIELSNSVVDLAVEIAGKIVGNELSVEQQRHLAERYLAEVSEGHEQ